MPDQDYKHGGWKDKYIIFKNGGPCSRCGGRCREGLTQQWHGDWGGGFTCRACKGTGCSLDRADPDATYFVLRLDADLNARAAALAYAGSVEAVNPQFAADIRGKVATAEAAKEGE